MRYLSCFLIIACVLVSPAFGQEGGGEGDAETADGFVLVKPVRERSCVAVRVDVPANQAISGIRWFNGSSNQGFPKVLLASGEDVKPPVYSEAIVLGENVTGTANEWSEMTFTEPVASLTGTLFVILQYPPNYDPVEGELPVGVGYKEQMGVAHYFVSGDGDHWLKVSQNWELMIEPVYVAREADMILKRGQGEEDEPEVEKIPSVFALKTYPNPFNPETQLVLSLPQRTRVSVKIFDLRGRLVRTLFSGDLEAGTVVLKWQGRDDQGRRISSGVYYALVQAGEKSLTNRLVLIK